METRGKYISPIRKSPAIPTLVAEQIIDLIRQGMLKPGDKLPSEHEMTERFHISRISLREAMKLLEAKGFVESRHRKGKFVKSPLLSAKTSIEDLLSVDHQKIWELLCVRRILDAEAARLACEHATKKDIERLRHVYERATKVGEDKVLHDVQEGGKLYTEFFTALLASTKNSMFAHIRRSVNSILIGAFPYSRKKLSTIEGSSRTIVHQLHAIEQAIASRDAYRAREAVVEHIDYLKKSLKKALSAS
ncbi:MAG TPA: FadR/GntR family transcriptional regulator [Deltaproteobacteria bacterium]|nr:FadR/GntR family transcriptional regulator [Deltaproteobacteria bacterium]HPR54273.1 FadR/GntR family transcriptional regulator [Deltaproteobacteria bacterium]HXK45815.1 FadR/GntR family transcriptional regulator [Deltaproteobacteria bacterium]